MISQRDRRFGEEGESGGTDTEVEEENEDDKKIYNFIKALTIYYFLL